MFLVFMGKRAFDVVNEFFDGFFDVHCGGKVAQPKEWYKVGGWGKALRVNVYGRKVGSSTEEPRV